MWFASANAFASAKLENLAAFELSMVVEASGAM
jgi:hypothetical protein